MSSRHGSRGSQDLEKEKLAWRPVCLGMASSRVRQGEAQGQE